MPSLLVGTTLACMSGSVIPSTGKVLLGVLVDFSGLQKEFLASLGIVAVLFVARLIAVQISRVAWHGTTARDREVVISLIQRCLITAVLALDAIRATKPQLDFLTPLAFATILLTNVLVLLAAIRAKGLVPQVAPAAVAMRLSESFPA